MEFENFRGRLFGSNPANATAASLHSWTIINNAILT